MLRRLRIQNYLLVDECTLEFEKGLNVLTGETGAGKTALVEAICLVMGMRADVEQIRLGSDKAVVEVAIELQKNEKIAHLLHGAGIDYDPEEWLIIRREIVREGKSRAFVAGAAAPLSLLQKIGAHLFEFAAQSSQQELLKEEVQRSYVDLFADNADLLLQFDVAHQETLSLEEKLISYTLLAQKKERELPQLQEEVKELSSYSFAKSEEMLFSEYKRLTLHQEMSQQLQEILHLSEELLGPLKQIETTLKTAAFDEATLHASLCRSSLQQLHTLVTKKMDAEEVDSRHLASLDKQLKDYHNFTRRYGAPEKLASTLQELGERIDLYQNAEEEMQRAQEALLRAKEMRAKKAELLTESRKRSALRLQEKLTDRLRELNMEGASLAIQVTPSQLTSSGEDKIEFLVYANRGEAKSNLSGGELSRLYLAIKLLFAEKSQVNSLIFDEIDAGIGGVTGARIGQLLKELGRSQQVFCITHFPQVAACAEHHYAVKKEEVAGRTTATIDKLTALQKKQELLRMLGGKAPAGVSFPS